MSARAIALACAAAIAFCSCTAKRISDIDEPSVLAAHDPRATWLVPQGVVTTLAQRGQVAIDGLYPSTIPNDRRCCWIATKATVTVAAPLRAATLGIDVLVPDYPFFEATPQSLLVTIRHRSIVFDGLGVGVHRLHVDRIGPLDALPDGEIHVSFVAARQFVPARERVNGDTRSLGVILLAVRFEDHS